MSVQSHTLSSFSMFSNNCFHLCQTMNSFPGQLCFFHSWFFPQNLHFFSVCLALWACLVLWIACTSSIFCPSIVTTFSFDSSEALHIRMHFSNVKSVSVKQNYTSLPALLNQWHSYLSSPVLWFLENNLYFSTLSFCTGFERLLNAFNSHASISSWSRGNVAHSILLSFLPVSPIKY